MDLNVLILQLGIFFLSIDLLIILIACCYRVLLEIFFIDKYYTWKFNIKRLILIISCILIIVFMFYLNYNYRLGKTVYLDQSITKLFNFYLKLNLLIYIKSNFLQTVLCNVLILVLIFLFCVLLRYYIKMVRVSFISLYYYLRYLDWYKKYPYEYIKTFIYYFDEIHDFLSLIDTKINFNVQYYFCKDYANHESFLQSRSYLWYSFFHRPFRNVIKFGKDNLGHFLLFYYIILFLFYGQIELNKIYYILIYVSLIRLISSIIHFLIHEYCSECIPFNILVWSTYEPQDFSIGLKLFPFWHSLVGNLNDIEGFSRRADAIDQYEYRNLITLDGVHAYVYGELSFEVRINKYIKNTK